MGKKETILFKSEERKELAGVVTFLRQLADKLAENHLSIQKGQQEIQLTIPATVTLEVKAEEELKKGQTEQSLEIEISWIKGDDTGGELTLG
jgi:amphi-Trp domain-containing protein